MTLEYMSDQITEQQHLLNIPDEEIAYASQQIKQNQSIAPRYS